MDRGFKPECTKDPDLFFRTNQLSIKQAKQICDGCPVQQECASLGNEKLRPATSMKFNHFGVWGGVSAKERYPNFKDMTDND